MAAGYGLTGVGTGGGGNASGYAVYNVMDDTYGAIGDGTTDDRQAIQDALDDAYAAGGGLVYLPAGTYGIDATSDSVTGGLQIQDNVTLMGDGMGATTIKLLDVNDGSNVTGIVRTPTGVANRNVSIRNLTIDGNKANVTPATANGIKGLFFGVSPSHRAKITVSGTTGTVDTYADDGTTPRNHGLTTNDVVYFWDDRSENLNGDFTVTVTDSNTFTVTVVSGTPTDSTGYLWYYDDPYSGIADSNIHCEAVEIKNCDGYGFDPHERLKDSVFINCHSHDNGTATDGFTFDGCFNVKVIGCSSHDNGNNGFTATTGSNGVEFIGCNAYSNGQYGISISNGSNPQPRTANCSIIGGNIFSNTSHGVRVQMGLENKVQGATIYKNGGDGIRLDGCQRNNISDNTIWGNGQTVASNTAEIGLREYTLSADSVTYQSQYNIIAGNTLDSRLTNKAKYSILEKSGASANYNLIGANRVITAGADGGVSTSGANTLFAAVRMPGVYDADLSGVSTITWDSTPPSGSANTRYSWNQIGGRCFYDIRLEYATPGTTNTSVSLTLPTDMPSPLDPTGAGNSEHEYAASGQGYTSMTGNGSAAKASLAKNSGGSGWDIALKGMTAGSFVGAVIAGSYPVAASARL